jgi:hypothetical protein
MAALSLRGHAQLEFFHPYLRMSTRKQAIAFLKAIETAGASGRLYSDMRKYDLERPSWAVNVTHDRKCDLRAREILKEYYFRRDFDNRIMEISEML